MFAVFQKKKILVVLKVLFPNIITKSVYTDVKKISNENANPTLIVIGDDKSVPTEAAEGVPIVQSKKIEVKEIYLFGEKEFNEGTTFKGLFHSSSSQKNEVKKIYCEKEFNKETTFKGLCSSLLTCICDRCSCICDLCPRCCTCECYLYTYFISVAFLATLWGMTLIAENLFYRKTGTCNDINVEDKSYTCFNVHGYTQVNCLTEMRPSNTTVFCYLYSPSPGAIGIGFGTYSAIIFGVTVYFNIAIKLAERANRNFCCAWSLLCIQIILAFLGLMGMLVVTPLLETTHSINVYFFHGNAVLRWAMYFILIITIPIVILVPWCGFTKEDRYRNMVLNKELNKELGRRNYGSMDTPDVV